MSPPILVARTPTDPPQDCWLLPQLANRHGLIAGATGTGKTLTLQTLIEQFSQRGVPVLAVDVKGDLAGLSQAGGGHAPVAERLAQLGLEPTYRGCPVTFWDLYGDQGHPLRTTVSELGPLLLARLLGLNDTQTGILHIVFRVADDEGLLLLDLKDLRSLLQYVGDQAKTLKTQYGNISAASVGAIQRSLLALEQQGGDRLLGEPALALDALIRRDEAGQGVVNILAASRLVQSPPLYATLLLWLLSALFEHLPEVGDPDVPVLVLVFDEAHLLFDRTAPALTERVEQVVRLIRSKGVGLYFCTQTPLDVPNGVLGQLGNRVQHALRAYTPADHKVVKAVAQTFRPNPAVDAAAAIAELAVGEALVSCLEASGAPAPVQRSLVVPPGSQVGAIPADQRRQILQMSPLAGRYDQVIDRESAYELLAQRAEAAQRAADQAAAEAKAAQAEATRQKQLEQAAAAQAKEAARQAQEREKLLLELASGAAQAIGGTQGKKIVRGVMGGILGYGKRR